MQASQNPGENLMVTMSTAAVTFSYLSEPRGADADAASQAPISSFPLAVQETLAVNDLLSILIGIDAKYIHIKVLRNLPHRSSIPSPVPILLHSFQPTLQPQTPNSKPQTPNPKPQTQNLILISPHSRSARRTVSVSPPRLTAPWIFPSPTS